ncbi:MAG: TlpA disulfide reductase family protein [Candidatus Berkelbacteria bacterium]|nr:TlpA disulfide reductase family protein [Candidatus Berkelbacteria bacterium]
MLNRLVAPLVFIIALAALAFVMQTLGNSSPANKPLTGPELLKQYEIVEIAPPVASLTDKDNKKVDLQPLLTKPTLITFWSVNCGECETGIPLLNEFSKNHSQITQLLISEKDEPKDAEEKLKSLDVTLGTYYDLDGSAVQSWEAQTMPASFFVINGKVKYFFPGRISQEHLDALLTVQ